MPCRIQQLPGRLQRRPPLLRHRPQPGAQHDRGQPDSDELHVSPRPPSGSDGVLLPGGGVREAVLAFRGIHTVQVIPELCPAAGVNTQKYLPPEMRICPKCHLAHHLGGRPLSAEGPCPHSGKNLSGPMTPSVTITQEQLTRVRTSVTRSSSAL